MNSSNIELNLKDIKKQLNENIETLDIELGDTKKVTIKKWSGVHLIQYGKHLEELEKNIENVEIYDAMMSIIYSTLIEPCLVGEKVFLNNHERHYVLIKIREFSLPNAPVTHSFVCDNEQCNNIEQVPILISDLTPTINLSHSGALGLSNGIILHIGDMKNPDAMKGKDKETMLLNELCLRVNKVEYNNNSTTLIVFDDLLDIVCSLPSTIFNELIDRYIEQFSFSYELPLYTHTCSNCKKEYKIDCNDLLMLVEGL